MARPGDADSLTIINYRSGFIHTFSLREIALDTNVTRYPHSQYCINIYL